MQRLFQCACHRGFTGARQPGKPQHNPTVTVELFALGDGDRMRMPDDVLIMGGHHLPPSRSRAPQCGKCLRTSAFSSSSKALNSDVTLACASGSRTMPAPTVTLVRRSMKISPPVTGFC